MDQEGHWLLVEQLFLFLESQGKIECQEQFW